MSLLSGILQTIAGALEIAAGVVLSVVGLPEFGVMLIAAGAGMLMSGIGTIIVGNPPVRGFATTTRNSIAPWDEVVGEARVGGDIVFMNTWGNNDQMLDLVIVVAAHPCQSIDELLFDQQRVQIDTTAIPTSAKAGYTIPTPAAGSGTSFSPLQEPVNIENISRIVQGVVTVVLSKDIPYLTAGDQFTVQNVTADLTLNGIFTVAEIISRVPFGGTYILTFSYLNGGAAVDIAAQGQVVTRWADYQRNVYFEPLLGTQTLGQTFVGMTAGTPWQGTGRLVTPASPLNAAGQATINQWTNYCSLVGKTAVFLRLQYVQKAFPNGIPQISFHVTGKNNIYDPRTETYGYTQNAALIIADYLADQTYGFKAAYGTDIPTAPLIAAANVCDEAVDLVIGGTENRYSCNGKFSLDMKRGEVLQNLLTSCGGRLLYTEGQYIINPAQAATPLTPDVDLQAIASGSMKWRPTVSIRDLYNGAKGTYISSDNGYVSTDIPPYAQDYDHGYDGPSEYSGDQNLADDGGDRRWLEIQLPFTTSSATAQRLCKIELLRRRHWGTGTFQCNMAGYQFVPLDVILADSTFFGWTGKELEISAVRLRSEKAPEGEGWILGTEIDVQETDSDIYVWSTEEELSPQGFVISNYPRNTVIEQNCYPWSPGYVSPLSGDAYGGGASFGLQPVYGFDASENGIINMQIKGTSPVNVLDTDIASPLIFVTGLDTGGTIPAGDYVIALTARDAGIGYKLSDYQAFGNAPIDTATGSITVNVTWGSGDDGGDLYIGQWTGFEDGYVFHHNQTLASTDTTVTITDFNQATPGGIDYVFDHFGIVLKQVIHSGPWAQIVSAVTSTTITIQGPTDSTTMLTNEWAGYNVALLAKADTTVEIPLLYIPIASSTASAGDGTFTLTVGPNSLSDTLPDLTTLLAPGDLLSMCFNATYTANSFTDSGLANAFYPGGATMVEAGHVVVVLTGADAGDVVSIASVDSGVTINLAANWAVTPTTGDLMVICNPADVPEISSLPIHTSTALTGTMASPSMLNYADSVWLIRVRTEDVNNNHNDDSLAPHRIVYIFGSAGNVQPIIGQWAPYQVQAPAADALFPNEWTFDLRQEYTVLSDGTALARLIATGCLTVNDFIPGSVAPVLFQGNIVQSTTGGHVPGGSTVYCQVCGTNTDGRWTPPSNMIEVVVAPGTNTNKFTLDDVTWPSTAGLTGYVLFANTKEDLICSQATGSGTPSTIAFTGTLQRSTLAVGNSNIQTLRLKAALLTHGGVLGASVDSVSGSTITSAACIAASDAWTGRVLAIIGRPPGNGATATATLTSGAVSSFTVLTPGVGYDMPPTVVIDGDGSGATATATVVAGQVTAITVATGGTAYTTTTISFVAQDTPSTGESPYISFNITGFDTTTGIFTLDRAAVTAGHPELSIQPGDAFVVGFAGYDNSGDPTVFTDAGIENGLNYDPITSISTPYSGLYPNQDMGCIMRVLAGFNRGAKAKIISNTATSYTFDSPLPMDSTSFVVVESSTWEYVANSKQIDNNAPLTQTQIPMPTDNFFNTSVICAGVMVDENNVESTDVDDAIRMSYIFGKPFDGTNFSIAGQATFGLDDDSVGINKVQKYYNVHFAGHPFIGSISCVNPPTTQSTYLDILYSSDQGATWTSIFPSGTGNQIVYTTGEIGLHFFGTFDPAAEFSIGDIVRIDSLQAGGATGLEIVVKYGPPLSS